MQQAIIVWLEQGLRGAVAGRKLGRFTHMGARRNWGLPMQYAVTAAFLLAVVAGSFAAVILGAYGIAQLIVSAL
jgi:hypothetical protein